MKITFYGAAQEVTGSMYLLEVNGQRILLECGLFQGHRADTYARNLNFPFDPSSIDALILSHAHIDHAGNIPNLVKWGFRGNIWSTAATRNLCTYMLMDSGHIHEQDVLYLNQQKRRRGEPPVQPLYTRSDAQAALSYFVSVGYHRAVPVVSGVTVTFFGAGHILGAASVLLEIQERGSDRPLRLAFSGDIGREQASILRPPQTIGQADAVIMESTYGDRLHDTYEAARRALRNVVRATYRRRGKVIIPAFAVGRTQELIYALNQLDADGEIPPLPIYVDSPLAVNATDVFRMHPEEWDQEVQAFLDEEKRPSPFDFHQVEFVRDVRRSKQLNFLHEPAVIISASGMAEHGRILHHLKHNIGSPVNTVLLVSFQAQHTLGRRLLDGERRVRIFGEWYDVAAQVESIAGYSAHADQAGLLAWAAAFDPARLQRIFVVHGEPDAAAALADRLRQRQGACVDVPVRGQAFTLD